MAARSSRGASHPALPSAATATPNNFFHPQQPPPMSSSIVYNHGASQPVVGIEGDALSCDLTLAGVLETVTGAHCLIASLLGPDRGRHGLQHVEVYALRRTHTRVWRASWYDAQWLRSWSWLCVRRGPYENGSGCTKSWRRRGWVCPDLLPYL